MPCIRIADLKKDYTIHRKEPGLLGAVKGLFARQTEIKTAVDGISFDVDAGEFVGFIGPNGAGKTTTIKMLTGILYPTSGHTEVLGFTPSERKHEFLRQIAFVMGNKVQLWWDLPAMDSLCLLRDIYQVPEKTFRQAVDTLTELLGLSDLLNIQVRKLSLGERMKCELMAALIHMPKVLFLDEPTIGLDLISRKSMREFLKKYNEETGATIILTSHYLEDIKELCKRIVFINGGHIMYDGQIADLMSGYAGDVIVKCTFSKPLDSDDKGKLSNLGTTIESLTDLEVALRVPRSHGAGISSMLARDFPVEDLLIEELPLDGIVARMYANVSVG
jgi:ABC-2 type transport system ATP-binding protein